jgi:glycosyltransferase involved in cell wall biosynthesis
MRLAWFSPWPPQKSGVAGRSAELVPLLAQRGHAIDVFADDRRLNRTAVPDAPPEAGRVRVITPHDFVWRHAKQHYDLAVYQVGNSHLHQFIWPYMFRYPGLAVLHDARLHHARAAALLGANRTDDYRAEFAWSHPDASPSAAEFAIQRIDSILFYQWPMIRAVIETARLVGAHSRGVADRIAREFPGRPVEHIALGEGPVDGDTMAARRQFRSAHGLPEDAIVFGVHGGLTREKRILDILSAFAAIKKALPDVRLVLAGAADPSLNLDVRIADLGLTSAICRVTVADDAEFDRAIAASDITLNLRWPSALETSGPWVRSLAMGRPTVIVDMAHQAHVPALDPRTWHRHEPTVDLEPGADDRAVTVAVDIRDIGHSLQLAMRRLARDAELRGRLGRRARAWWEREHTVDRMVTDYERAIARAVTLPLPSTGPDWPAHLRPDPAALTHELLRSVAFADATVRDRLSGL